MKSILTTLFLFLIVFKSDIQKRKIRQDGFNITCFINSKKIKNFNNSKMYFWYKSGKIHFSKGNIGGNVLDKVFLKYNKKNQLLEKGEFKLGLKNGVWTTWYNDGTIKSITNWKKGFKAGKYISYSLNEKLIESGSYYKNRKNKTWINYLKKDTLYYDKGLLIKEKKVSFINKILKKIN